LLQPYEALRSLNVDSVRHIIDLARLGTVQTHIHHLSTWSVPHLQTWSTSHRTRPHETVATEGSARHFTPEASSRFGYFKSRWVAERLMEAAAQRGFPVTIYRASAATGSTATGVPEPKDDFIRTMILSMVRAGAIPSLSPATDDRPFVADFVPVDYLTESFHALAMAGDAPQDRSTEAAFYHLSNPSALPISELPGLVGHLLGRDDLAGKVLPVAEWLDTVSRMDESPEARVRWEVLREYFDLGHHMFALDVRQTHDELRAMGVANCPPVQVEYLRKMLESS
jgi:thioester reductase-like protein